MATLIRHPFNDAVINFDKFTDIRKCSKNPTHVDFYVNPQAENERGNPDYTINFKTTEERDTWFEGLFEAATK
jgi:hypothetical protein